MPECRLRHPERLRQVPGSRQDKPFLVEDAEQRVAVVWPERPDGPGVSLGDVPALLLHVLHYGLLLTDYLLHAEDTLDEPALVAKRHDDAFFGSGVAEPPPGAISNQSPRSSRSM